MSFIERRKDYRIPYFQKLIFTDGKNSLTGIGLNLSRGGMFFVTLNTIPLDTQGYLCFMLPQHPNSLCVKAKVAHIVMDRQRAEVDCGMGLQFLELDKSQRSLINLHVMNQQSTYQRLQTLLKEPRPDFLAIGDCIKRLPNLTGLDLATLRYRVNRICTIFEAHSEHFDLDEKTQIMTA